MRNAALRFFVAASPSFATEACSYRSSVYEHREDPRWRVRFVPLGSKSLLSDMALHLEGPDPGNSYWFLYDAGSAPIVALISTTNVLAADWAPPPSEGGNRPLRDLQIYVMDETMKMSVEVPKASDASPKYLFIPMLTEALRSVSLRHWLAPGVFKRIACA